MIYSLTMEAVTCCNCHMPFGMSEDFYNARRKDNENFYCPRGHQQHFTGKSNEQKLREQLQEEKIRNESLRASLLARAAQAAKFERANRRLKKRAAAGVCPCCNRTVAQMARHMKTKHPEYVTKVE